ncbi:hypothetical protein [Methanolacinia petrolearia]|uniref:hypothetical protein n=1 Tax=Methanolacinia petrolearia TaxID=54120 RepID=UPI003BAB0D0F
MDQLISIKKDIEFLKGIKIIIDEFLRFEKEYQKQVEDRHKNISIPHFDQAKSVPVNELYVSPNFYRDSQKDKDDKEIFDVNGFYHIINRAVLLGYPGGGKSTLSQKICYDLTHSYSKRIFGGREITPLLVVLRDYGVQKRENNFSILDFIESFSNTKYQSKPPKGALEYMLRN